MPESEPPPSGAPLPGGSGGSSASPVVVADDNPDDLFFFKRALKQAGCTSPVLAFEHGQDAVNGLGQMIESPACELPCFLFLDIKMPRLSGFEVLAWARRQPRFSTLPIVMLSGSQAADDVAKAKELGATDYLVKPASAATLRALLFPSGGNSRRPFSDEVSRSIFD